LKLRISVWNSECLTAILLDGFGTHDKTSSNSS
jgi:hypothetical protein